MPHEKQTFSCDGTTKVTKRPNDGWTQGDTNDHSALLLYSPWTPQTIPGSTKGLLALDDVLAFLLPWWLFRAYSPNSCGFSQDNFRDWSVIVSYQSLLCCYMTSVESRSQLPYSVHIFYKELAVSQLPWAACPLQANLFVAGYLHSVSSRQKLALWPSATLLPWESRRS